MNDKKKQKDTSSKITKVQYARILQNYHDKCSEVDELKEQNKILRAQLEESNGIIEADIKREGIERIVAMRS